MTERSFNADWTVRAKTSIFAQLRAGGPAGTPVVLPHDALVGADRSPSNAGAQAFYPGGAFEYVKTFDVPDEWRDRRVSLVFHGAYRDAMVFVNDAFVAQRPDGYSEFVVEIDPYLRYGTRNTVRAEVRARDDSRWYTGAGLHRDVRLVVADLVHVEHRGITVTTTDVDDERAVVEVAMRVRNAGVVTQARQVDVSVDGPGGSTVARSSPVTVRPGETAVVRVRLYVDDPVRWSVEHPHLYALRVALRDGERAADEHRLSFGIRTLQLDPWHGLRINGSSVKLRGACVHHDNGILGMAGFARAEERKVELLKGAGFNAVRAAHAPFSEAFLAACDRLGMLVMDEAFDMWADSKSPLDYSLAFPEWWERDLEAMVAKDRNHPSVIMYSIGNEIPEVGDAHGAAQGRAMVEKIRALDSTRFVTNGINAMVAVMPEVLAMREEDRQAGRTRSDADGVNEIMAAGEQMMRRVIESPMVAERTAESFSVLDVAGWNYGDARYVMDREAFPDRVAVGTETFPNNIAANWALVSDLPHVIGDFTWTGLDYLGEVGVGRMQYADEPNSFEGPYPWITAWCGDLDLVGARRPASFYREIVFGLRREPYIAVHRPENHDRVPVRGRWSWSDSISSWTWDVEAGTPIRVETYADADEVELCLDGEPIGRSAIGETDPFTAVLEVAYHPGELTAIAYRDGVEAGRTSIRSATTGPRLVARADRETVIANHGDLAFIELELRDGQGTLITSSDRELTVSVDGPGVLQALGSGRPATTERYDTGRHTTFDGRALAVVRPTGPGTIRVVACGPDLEDAIVTIRAESTDVPA
jgi:beta-galactosidase